MDNNLNKIIKLVDKEYWITIITIEGKFNYLKKICEENSICNKCLLDETNTYPNLNHVKEFKRRVTLTDLASSILN
jgi:hypothetical protein